MDVYGWLQILLYLAVLTALTKPLGIFISKVFNDEKTFLDVAVKPFEKLIYRVARVDAKREMNWKEYGAAILIFSFASTIFLYIVQRLQGFFPLNPQSLNAPSEHLSFNTAISFVSNTNWQAYGGETTMSYLTQMAGLTVQNFISAAVGMAVAIVFIRGIARHETDQLGSFWVDLVRGVLYILLPLSFIFALCFVSQGVIQNFNAYDSATTLEGATQTIAQGSTASQLAIKQLGTNGGGFFNVNSSHPFENPTPLSNFFQLLLILLIPSAFTYTLGRMFKNQKHGWAVWAAMLILLCAGIFISATAESHGNPLFPDNVNQTAGNMEGKETRFGVVNSVLWATATTAASNGSVNSMHDSFTPVGGLVPLVNILLGEVIFGGVGAGMYGVLIFVILTVFIAGLMVGRTPEYLGKKIEAYDVQMAMLYALIFPLIILGGAAIAVSLPETGLSSLNNQDSHGLSEILYAYTSAGGNNGSAFAGLNANTMFYNTTLGLAMLFGRFFMIIPVLAIAGNLARKKFVPPSAGTFPVNSLLFTVLLTAIILIVGALTFFPVLSLGGIVEHLQMLDGKTF